MEIRVLFKYFKVDVVYHSFRDSPQPTVPFGLLIIPSHRFVGCLRTLDVLSHKWLSAYLTVGAQHV